MARHPEVLLKTMVEKELGLAVEEAHGSPLQGSVIMGAAFGLGSAFPLVPYVLLPVSGGATYVSVILTVAVLFGIGVMKSRWTRRRWFESGTEIVLLGAFAGIVGYFFGSVLPALLGAPSGG
jgi:predicted membrane protein (TIGR00267 family)